ncbi:MAG: MSMEG_4193 family putative phosphomutase [Nitriliruptor sp.]
MTTIALVRHATTAATGHRLGGWTPGVHLDDAGVAQAEATAQRLSELPVAAVYASPLERTQETAKHIARVHGLRVRTRRAIGEVDYGDWTDRPLAELRREKLWKVIQATPSRVTFPGGESIRAAQHRATDALEALAAQHGDETIVAVSHADVIKAVLAHLLGMPLDTFQRLHVAPASISLVHLAEGAAPAVTRINDSGPLTAPTRRAGRRGTSTRKRAS